MEAAVGGVGVTQYNVTDAAIEKMRKEYLPLKIVDIHDSAGIAQVHQARMEVKRTRVAVEKRRKELKRDALEWGRKVDAEAKRIFGLLEPIESHLKAEEEKVIREKERIKAEKERKEKERVDGIRQKISAIQGIILKAHAMNSGQIAELIKSLDTQDEPGEEEFAEFTEEARQVRAKTLADLGGLYEAKVAQERAEEERRKEEARLEKLRKEREAEEHRLAEERRKLEEERARIEAERRVEQERKEREEREKREAEERARKEAEEKARMEALRPDKEKLLKFADRIQGIEVPTVMSDEAKEISAQAKVRLDRIAEEIRNSVNGLRPGEGCDSPGTETTSRKRKG